MYGEEGQFGVYTNTETGCESADNQRLEGKSTLVIGDGPVIIDWAERQVDGLKVGQLVNVRKQTLQFADDLL